MKTEYDFFMIEREHLKGKNLFPFQLYVFNPIHKKYSMFLNGNRPLTKDLDAFMSYLLDRGAKLAVLKKQRRTFLNAQEFSEADIPSLHARELHPMEKERIMHLKFKDMYEEKNGLFSFQTEFEKACETDNFEKIIEAARIEILTFTVTQSHTVSLAIHLAKNHLQSDIYLNRIVAVSYFIAKNANIQDTAALSDIICGAYLSHIGYTQLPLGMVRTSVLSLGEKERRLFFKHAILGSHLIKKSQVEISERCARIILDHHERINGGGQPAGKSGESIEPLSQIVGAISHMFEYSGGKINGNKQSLRSVILSIKNKSFIPGLEFDFGDNVYNSLVTLINADKIEEKKAA